MQFASITADFLEEVGLSQISPCHRVQSDWWKGAWLPPLAHLEMGVFPNLAGAEREQGVMGLS